MEDDGGFFARGLMLLHVSGNDTRDLLLALSSETIELLPV